MAVTLLGLTAPLFVVLGVAFAVVSAVLLRRTRDPAWTVNTVAGCVIAGVGVAILVVRSLHGPH